MKRMLILGILLLSSGCVSVATREHIATQAAVHDQATLLIKQELGKLSEEQVAATPAPVQTLLLNTIRLVWESRESWHTLNFTLGKGPDPETLELDAAPGSLNVPD